jgi:mannose-1-phosphate guanylyltransferase
VAAGVALRDAIATALPDLPHENLIVESEARDTGPAAVHAAWFVEQRRPGSVLVNLPADHLVTETERFVEAMQRAAEVASGEEALVCLGITPRGPSSAYGYLQCTGPAPGHARVGRVERFVEKPDPECAAALLADGRCMWNAGMFVWTARSFLSEAARVSPELAAPLAALQRDADPAAFFRLSAAISVDRAVLERAAEVRVVGARIGWDDLGDWESLLRHRPVDARGNLVPDGGLVLESSGCIAHTSGKPVVLLEVDDLVLVECDDVILVTRRAALQRLREVPARLEEQGRLDLT